MSLLVCFKLCDSAAAWFEMLRFDGEEDDDDDEDDDNDNGADCDKDVFSDAHPNASVALKYTTSERQANEAVAAADDETQTIASAPSSLDDADDVADDSADDAAAAAVAADDADDGDNADVDDDEDGEDWASERRCDDQCRIEATGIHAT
jgi:hypothetical protein